MRRYTITREHVFWWFPGALKITVVFAVEEPHLGNWSKGSAMLKEVGWGNEDSHMAE
jgi:hypothetical protein